ncbi:MAG: DUF305 domain-containing protein [Nocardioidaceae bacterium]
MPSSFAAFPGGRLAALAVTAGLVVALAACGNNDPSTRAAVDSSPPSATTSTAGEHIAADVTFAQMMIPHHQQAIQMAALAAARAADPQVKALAEQIEAAQDPEITTMKSWLSGWGEPTAAAGMNESMGHGMDGMMSDADMAKLTSLSGGAFEREFLIMMTAHHRGAIEMAKTERASGSYGPAKELATSIIRTQAAEIEKMRTLLQQV